MLLPALSETRRAMRRRRPVLVAEAPPSPPSAAPGDDLPPPLRALRGMFQGQQGERRSSLLGTGGRQSVFPPKKATSGLLATPPGDAPDDGPVPAVNTLDATDAGASTGSDGGFWRDWKKVTLDVYVRLLDRPRDTRVRLKQTVALLPILKLKPVIDLAYRGPSQPPVSMHLDVKALGCIKYRVRQDGSQTLQVRARAPLADPRFLMDVVYERNLATSLDSVKLSFRGMGVGFLKAPRFGAGCKVPIRFDNGVKSTIRVKKFLFNETAKPARKKPGRGRTMQPSPAPRPWYGQAPAPGARQQGAAAPRFGIFGPAGVDIKFRCFEYS